MKYIVLFEDNADAAPDLRQQHMAAHLAFLEANADRVDAAGPLFHPDGAGAGGLWLVESDDPTEVEQLIHADPFWPTGLRKSYSIMRWTRVFADGKRI